MASMRVGQSRQGSGVLVAVGLVLLGTSCLEATDVAQAEASLECPDATCDFGEVPAGSTKELALRISNRARGTLVVQQLSLPAGTPFAFTFSGPVTIDGQRSIEVPLRFLPVHDSDDALTTYSSELTVQVESPRPAALRVPLLGRGRSAFCSVAPVLDLGRVEVGQTGSLSYSLPNDTGRAVTMTVSRLSGDAALRFGTGTAAGSVGVPPGGAFRLAFEFSPTEAKQYRGTLKVRRAAGCPEREVVILAEGGPLLALEPSWLDFGHLALQRTALLTARLRNHGLEAVTLNSVRITPDAGVFEVRSVEPLQVPAARRVAADKLEPGESVATLAFTPRSNAAFRADIEFNTSSASRPRLRLPVEGFGGGPRLGVPASVSMGRVQFLPGAQPRSHVVRLVEVRNAGQLPSSDSRGHLRLRDPPVTVRALQGTEGELCVGAHDGTRCQGQVEAWPEQGLPPNAPGVLVPFRVTPMTTGAKRWEVTFHSNDVEEPDLTVTVTAEAVTLPPCALRLSPARLDFGNVGPGQVTLGVVVTNQGRGASDECVVSHPAVVGPNRRNFALATDFADVSLGPGEQRLIAVTATGGEPPGQPLAATLQFYVSSEGDPRRTVELEAVAGEGCLFAVPARLDFGTVRNTCAGVERTLVVHNRCWTALGVTVALESANVVAAGTPGCGGARDCVDLSVASTSFTLPARGQRTLNVRHVPGDRGPDTAAVALRTREFELPVKLVVPLRGEASESGANRDSFRDPRSVVDVLWVVVEGKENDVQDIARNLGGYVEAARATNADLKLAMTSSEEDDAGATGRFLGPDGGTVLTNLDTLASGFSRFGLEFPRLGVERVLGPALAALTVAADAGSLQNRTFLRPEARLSVVLLSDSREQSDLPVASYVSGLQALKGGWPGAVKINALLPGEPSCGISPPRERFDEAAAATDGLVLPLCPGLANSLRRLGEATFERPRTFFLTRAPEPGTLTVEIDGRTLPETSSSGTRAWRYEAASNSVTLEPQSLPPRGAELAIRYTGSCP